MPRCNILISCDQKYYDDWAHLFFVSAYNRNPWLRGKLHCHIINPIKFDSLPYVNYSSENIKFESENSKISYLQSARFLTVADRVSSDDFYVTLDADTVCTRSFDEEEFSTVFDDLNVLKHKKAGHWLAGFVTFSSVEFAKDYARRLQEIPLNEWEVGRDQKILAELSNDYSFRELDNKWMSYGKNIHDSVFYTLKGEQKTTEKYLNIYNRYKI